MWKAHDSGFVAAGLSTAYELEEIAFRASTCDLALIAAIVALSLFAFSVWRS